MGGKRYFIFMDETWNTKEEIYFWLWILMVWVDYVWDLYDLMRIFSDKAKSIAKLKKQEKIWEYIHNSDFSNLNSILSTTKDFELKFKNINFTNNTIYSHIIDTYFNISWTKFAALIIDKSNWSQDYDYWDLYIQRSAMLIAKTIKNEPDAEYVLICDGISQPKNKSKKFENSMMDCIKYFLKKDWINSDILFGVMREESHASLLLQLVDILLWACLFPIKNKQWLISEKTLSKKWLVYNVLKKNINNKDTSNNITHTKDWVYFSVRHYNNKK